MPLRPFDETRDGNILRSWLTDPEAARWLTDTEQLKAEQNAAGITRWIFEQDGAPVGYGDLVQAPDGTYSRLLRVVVGRAHRRQRIGTTLVRALIEQARTTAPALPVYAGIDPNNLPALWACPAAGLVPLEPLPEHFDERLVWLTTPDDEPFVPGGPIDD